MRRNQELSEKLEGLREKAAKAESSAQAAGELEEMKEEVRSLREQLKAAQSAGLNEEGAALANDIDELEKRKAALHRDLAQAKSTIMDAASIMAKMKAVQDKNETLTRQIERLKAGGPGASTGGPPSESRTFGRGAASTGGDFADGGAGGRLKLKPAEHSESTSARSDSKSKFAKSLFGSVRGTKSK